ncbi:unnamed protein product [Meloidogyne enterolobii]|uniref:Uncharacterized protein n=3 Tax=Meloidogyne enterolobii TaxID=390850 RepID=A0ACB0XZR0_MELEN
MEVNQQHQEKTARSQLYELTPPMDPSNDNNDRTFRGKNNTKHSNSTTTCSPPTPPILFNRPRPTDLPGISAGLAAISANYGAIFDHQNNQDEQHQNSPVDENKLQQQNYSVGSLSEQFPLVAAAAYAFRNPQSAQFHSITPSLYSPYDGSQPSDPNTPTQQFGIGTSAMIGSQPPPTYATVSSMAAAANSTPFDAFLCNWYPLFGAGSSDLIGYSTAVEQQNNTNLLFHSPTVATAAQHLFTPPFDFCTTQQQLDSNSSILLDNSIQHQQHQLWLAEQFAEAAAISSNSSSNKSTTNSASSVFVPPLSVVSKSTPPTATVSAMPRGQPRRGGRRPREREEENLNDEDKGRRERRRERNKEAAARCRRRREERMSSLEGQVQLLQAANDEKDNLIRKLRDEQNRLLGILSKREESSMVCGEPSLKFEPQKFENEQGLLTFPLNTMALHHRQNDNPRVPSGGGIGILIPQLERTKIHPQQQQHPNQCFSLTAMNNTSCQHSSSSSSSAIAADTTESTEISPATPPPNLSSYDHRGIRNDSRGGCCSVLVNGTDPVISESALMETPTSNYSQNPPLFGRIKRAKVEPSPLLGGLEDHENADNRRISPYEASLNDNNRPTTLNLRGKADFLHKEGYIAITPSKGVQVEGNFQSQGGFGSFEFTPSSFLGTGQSYSVLGAQQTGLTPCQGGPVYVQTSSISQNECPPSDGELSILH